MKMSLHKTILQAGCILLICVLLFCFAPDLIVLALENPQGGAILYFESASPVCVKTVEQGTPAQDLPLPASLRAVLQTDGEAPFTQQAPGSIPGNYVATDNAGGVTDISGEPLALYFCTQNGDAATAFRIYGTLEGGGAGWFSCDAYGNIAGSIADVAVTWNCPGYDSRLAGEYTFTAVLGGYGYGGSNPYATVIVQSQEPEIQTASADEESEEEEEGGFGILATGTVTVNNVIYQYDTDTGEASAIDGSSASGDIVIPVKITGSDGNEYIVTGLRGITLSDGRDKPAFSNNQAITSIRFEEGSQVSFISDYAFNACGNLISIHFPPSATYIGSSVYANTGVKEVSYNHVVSISGSLPSLNDGTPPALPDEAAQYESTVDSTIGGTLLFKGAKWTNDDLTEAELRIDFGKDTSYNANIDFIFVLDQSDSMLIATTTTGDNGLSYTLPRALLTKDVVYSAAQAILDNAPDGYNNRIALTGFGDGSSPLWKSDFVTTAADVESILFNNPRSAENGTYYNAGLRGAIELINDRQDKSRTPVVIFLSDGQPTGTNSGTGEANTLRNMGVKVFPVGIYLTTSDLSALKAISYDRQTAYDARDTDALETIVSDVLSEITEDIATLNIQIADVLSQHFEFATGNASNDVTVSANGGTVSITGDTLNWDLTDCALDVGHYIIIKVKLKDGTALTASGTLPTNDSMGATDNSITSTRQPELTRYLVLHEFINGTDPGQPLPDEVTALLPPNKGGYRDQTPVTPTAPAQTEVTTAGGEKWVFVGWDTPQDTIDKDDVTFTGEWQTDTGGALQIGKTVTAPSGLTAPTDDPFTFEIQVDGNLYADQEYKLYNTDDLTTELPGGPYQTNSEGLFIMEAGQTAVFTNLPIDSLYTVTEQPRNNYTCTTPQSGAYSGEITDMSPIVLAFENLYAPALDFVFAKTDENGSQPLAGVEFTLYACSKIDEPGHVHSDMVTDDPNCCWQSYKTAVSAATTGLVTYEGLETGQYMLVETRTLPEYQLPVGQWLIDIDATAPTVAITAKGDVLPPAFIEENGSYKLPNYRPVSLPLTGKSDALLLKTTGILLATIAGMGALSGIRNDKKRRRKHKYYRL